MPLNLISKMFQKKIFMFIEWRQICVIQKKEMQSINVEITILTQTFNGEAS